MDELGAVWLSPQSEDDLKHKILLTNFELETVRMDVNRIKHQSEVNQKLLQAQLLLAFEERDEAKKQLQQLLDIFMLAPAGTQPQTLKQNPSEMITTFPSKPRSGLTDQSNNDINSFLDTVSSTEKSCKHTDNDSLNHYDDEDDELNSKLYNPMVFGAGGKYKVDLNHASVVIDQLVKGKVLPCKGRLLETVMTAGPTLDAMMLAGPLPRWKNPPPATQPLDLQPGLPNNGMMINNSGAANQRPFKPNLRYFAHNGIVTDPTDGLACLSNERTMMDICNNNKRHRVV